MKNNTAQLEAWLAKEAAHNPKVKRIIWAQFLAVADEIQAGINAGYSLKLIHIYLTDVKKIECNYDTFLRYQKRYVKQQNPLLSSTTAQAQEPKPALSTKPPKQTFQEKKKGFNFNPVPDLAKLV
ncbi:MAG: TraK family protein [Shewanella xiamenensis]|uniref:TraK family protein n=1 Tax=Shewanella TaxID=22 RepID=UPI000B49F7BD|nr:TraK family protein [Shewanella sp. Shew256]MCD8561258.1 TraK family protein [Shewanella xiamenensis]